MARTIARATAATAATAATLRLLLLLLRLPLVLLLLLLLLPLLCQVSGVEGYPDGSYDRSGAVNCVPWSFVEGDVWTIVVFQAPRNVHL